MSWHCCIRCGWVPLEGMEEYLECHADTAACVVCKYPLAGQAEDVASVESRGGSVEPDKYPAKTEATA